MRTGEFLAPRSKLPQSSRKILLGIFPIPAQRPDADDLPVFGIDRRWFSTGASRRDPSDNGRLWFLTGSCHVVFLFFLSHHLPPFKKTAVVQCLTFFIDGFELPILAFLFFVVPYSGISISTLRASSCLVAVWRAVSISLSGKRCVMVGLRSALPVSMKPKTCSNSLS